MTKREEMVIQDCFLTMGKRLDNGEWVEGYLSKSRYQGKGALVPCIDYEERGVMLSSCVMPDTIRKCTGHRDKNGKLIFEQHIVDFFFKGKMERGIIKWFYDIAGFMITNICNSWIEPLDRYDIEVIGDTYNNPELLEEAKEYE